MALASTLLVVVWVALLIRNHRVGWRFFAVGAGLVVLCFIGGPLVNGLSTPDPACRAQEGLACGMGGVTGAAWANGALALCCLVVLLVLTPLARLLYRHSSNAGAHKQ
ncbi:hypothetical protein DKT68_12395 [Micromonospora acroterricola]|uniref:Uncharacterized protein n=1 Tax=Micromonospora acroterricola TaxID=2202421 RepID=A0A317D6S4_9ACTN|nr:hypothetical protein DKT68_12395 [Micromonospora acroterricola]